MLKIESPKIKDIKTNEAILHEENTQNFITYNLHSSFVTHEICVVCIFL